MLPQPFPTASVINQGGLFANVNNPPVLQNTAQSPIFRPMLPALPDTNAPSFPLHYPLQLPSIRQILADTYCLDNLPRRSIPINLAADLPLRAIPEQPINYSSTLALLQAINPEARLAPVILTPPAMITDSQFSPSMSSSLATTHQPANFNINITSSSLSPTINFSNSLISTEPTEATSQLGSKRSCDELQTATEHLPNKRSNSKTMANRAAESSPPVLTTQEKCSEKQAAQQHQTPAKHHGRRVKTPITYSQIWHSWQKKRTSNANAFKSAAASKPASQRAVKVSPPIDPETKHLPASEKPQQRHSPQKFWRLFDPEQQAQLSTPTPETKGVHASSSSLAKPL